MAKIVLGVATPHAPQLRLPIEGWYALREKDETDRRIDYAGLLARAKPDMAEELSDERLHERYDAIQAGMRQIAEVVAQAQPDVLVVIGDDQHEQFHDELMPMFCVYRGESVQVARRGHGTRSGSGLWSAAKLDEIQNAVAERLSVWGDHVCEPALAEQVIDSLRDDGFDIAASKQLNEKVGLGHAFTYIYEFVTPNGDIPMVPVMINTFFPPNQPTPKRCYALGQALRTAIEGWDSDKRVAVIASGGLSHTILDEGIDRMALDAVLEQDGEALAMLPRERLNLGTSEIRNWIAAAGALEPLTPHLIGDYIPAYRSPAGTGCGVAFTYWD
jgi:hypothetical protein